MAKSLLSAFVSNTRALLIAQLIACVGAVALAGWTLGVTNQVLRERNRLQERVIQLEEAMAASGVIPPPPAAVVTPASQSEAYPPSVAYDNNASDDVSTESSEPSERDLGSVITGLFGPTPPLRMVFLHVRADADVAAAQRIARDLQTGGVRTFVNVIPANDQRQSGYAYFDGRQSRAAADIVARFHEIAREHQVAQWSAQLRGTALPAREMYPAQRLDIVLPPLPPPPPPPQPEPDPAAVATTPQP